MQRLLVLLLLASCLTPAFAAKVAILIGCNAYSHFNPLKCSVTAAGYQVYTMTGKEVDAKGAPLFDNVPSKGNIEHQLGVWAADRSYGVKDTLLFFFSGHGIRSRDGLDYLAPLDGVMKDDGVDFSSLVPMHLIYEQLRRSKAENLIIIADACRNEPGKSLEKSNGFGSSATKDITDIKSWGEQRVAWLYSCSEEQRSYEMPNGAGSYFTHFLTKGLNGEAATNGKVTASSLCAYVKERVRAAVAKAENGAQEPWFTFTNADPTAMVLADSIQKAPLSITITAPEALARGDELVCLGTEVTLTGYVSEAPGVELWYRGAKMPLGAVASELGAVRPFSQVLTGLQPGNHYDIALGLRDSAGRKVIKQLHIHCAQALVASNATPVSVNNKDGAELIFIPAGEFLMGSADSDKEGTTVEKPQHTVYLDAYYIYKNDVTVAQYRRFCAATGCRMPTPPKWGWLDDHPVVNVSWKDATQYADWAGTRLPTEAQWEKAARGVDGWIYPWGNDWDAGKAQCSHTEWGDAGKTAKVGSYPAGASPYGVMDMAGNVWQWCADFYDPNYYVKAMNRNPSGPRDVYGYVHVLRGGSWLEHNAGDFRTTNRYRNTNGGFESFGFRCVCDVKVCTN